MRQIINGCLSGHRCSISAICCSDIRCALQAAVVYALTPAACALSGKMRLLRILIGAKWSHSGRIFCHIIILMSLLRQWPEAAESIGLSA